MTEDVIQVDLQGEDKRQEKAEKPEETPLSEIKDPEERKLERWKRNAEPITR